ncbi:MAG: type II toxin-antitoxin system RatA family toxin [Alphaproteobacteria bacterium]
MPTHAEKRHLPYTPEQLFDLVADIERYPEFLPWCLGARIRKREGNTVHADLVIGFKMFRERFSSVDVFDRPRRIDIRYTKGPLHYLNNHWVFERAADGGCNIDFFIDFEFRSRLFQKMIGGLFNEAVRRLVQAFEDRAHAIYGEPQARGT